MPTYAVSTSSERLAVDITKDGASLVEVFCISFPRFTGTHCSLSTLEDHQQERFGRAVDSAKEVADRMTTDGRDATPEEIKKAFNRTFAVNEESK